MSSPSSRSSFTPLSTVQYLWNTLNLPPSALSSSVSASPSTSLLALHLPGSGPGLPSSFKVGHLAQASIALSACCAALFHSLRRKPATDDAPGSEDDPGKSDVESVLRITVPLRHACAEFVSERLYTLNGQAWIPKRTPIGGLHRAKDGWVRIHDGFRVHRLAALGILGLPEQAMREEIDRKIGTWSAVRLEKAAIENAAVIVALRSPEEWDRTPQGEAVGDVPILVRRIADGSPGLKKRLRQSGDKCLRSVRVVEMTRVIAAPVAGRTLAAHGADVLWVTSPTLESQFDLDVDTARGKRSGRLNLDEGADKTTLEELLSEADVFVQSYRPGSLAKKGFSPEQVVKKSREGIVYATLSAYGSGGPWSGNRGFDSIVQTCSGVNVAEVERFGAGDVSRVLPCQALDHASGYFLAAGIMAALYKQAREGGSYMVEVSLAGTMKYLKSLGQIGGRSGFDCEGIDTQSDVPGEYLEERESPLGPLKAVKHAASIEGVDVGWDTMPGLLGSSKAVWV